MLLCSGSEQMADMRGLKKAIKEAGGAVKVAGIIGVTRFAVYDYIRRGAVPAEHCPKIEQETGVACERLNKNVDWAAIRGTSKAAA